MYEAARVGDPIHHTSALTGFLVGALIGIALAAAAAAYVAFSIATCGVGGLLIGLLAPLVASALPSIGEWFGKMCSSPCGTITAGSRNVLIDRLPAATAMLSAVACGKDPPIQSMAEGSMDVFIDGLPAARKGDKTTCGGEIDSGSSNVVLGGDPVAMLPVRDEVPAWLRTAADWAITIASLVGGLAGTAAKMAARAGSLTLRAFLPCAAKFIAGFVVGEVVSRTVIAPVIRRVLGGLLGHPVSVTTGRKLLLADEEVDFEIASKLPLVCGRFYDSSLTTEGVLGRGWRLPWEVSLEAKDGQVIHRDGQGRETVFPRIAQGQKIYSEAEQKYLACLKDGRFIIYDLSETYYDFGILPAEGVANLRRIEDQQGESIRFERDLKTGRLDAIIDSSADRLRLTYDKESGRLVRIERQDGGAPRTLVRYEYNHQGQLSAVINRMSRVVRQFEYQDGLMTRHVDALGFSCSYKWAEIDGAPRVVEQETSDGEKYTFNYDPKARESWAEDTFGRKAHWQWDEHFQITDCQDFDGGQYQFEYTEAGNLAVLRLPGDRIVKLEYDPLGRLAREIDPLGWVTEYRYHGQSERPMETVLADGSIWRAEWDPTGRLLSETDPLRRVTRYEYGKGGLPIARIDATGKRQEMEWNRNGQVIAYTDCSKKVTHYKYDAEDNLIATTNALGEKTTYERQATGEITAVHHPDDTVERLTWNAMGQPISHQDEEGRTRLWERDARGQVVTYTDPSKRKLRYRYDAHGRLCELVNGNGASYRFDYDAGDRLSKEIRVDGIEEHFKYDTAGSLVDSEKVGKDDAGAERRRKALFIRDAKGNLLERRTETAITSYQYDPLDRAVSIQRLPTEAGAALGVGHDELRFEYDLASMLVAEHGANGSIEYKHDELGNVTKVALPLGKQEIETFYYGSGHALHIKVGDQVITEFERDDLHREILRTQGKLTNHFKYDVRSRLLSQAAMKGDEKTIWRDCRYNGVGELLESNDGLRGRMVYDYDSASYVQRRFGEEVERFIWDAAGNLLDDSQSRRDPISDNRLHAWRDLRLSYDAFGNLQSKVKGHHQQQHFEYDADDRLMVVKARTPNGESETRFAYDSIGRRIGKTHTEVPSYPRDPATRTERRFVWEGLRLVQEADSRTISTYVYDPTATYTPLARVDQSFAQDGTARPAKVYYFHTDPVGTPLEVTDAHGELVWAGKYKTWGTIEGSLTKLKMDRIEQNLRFPGQYQDTETGLYYNTFRYYDPEVGRFTTQDPIGLAGGENLYGYGPNTTGSIDPLGWCGSATRNGKIKYGVLPKNTLGETDTLGNITIAQGLSWKLKRLTIRHESVHAWLSPGAGPLQGIRAKLLGVGYKHSHLLRYVEEALAQGYATRSVSQGLAFPLTPGYGISALRVVAEGLGLGALVAGPGIAAYHRGS